MKVIITARNFNINGCNALKMLTDAGLEVLDYGDTQLTDDERLEIIKDAEIVIPSVEEMQAEFLAQCKKLKLISLRGIGYDNIDSDYCKEHGITLLRARGTLESSVAEQVIAYIMHFARRIDLQNEYMQNSEWNRIMMQGAQGKTLGLIGFGAIGKEIAKRADALGMKITYYCRHPKPEWQEQYNAKYLPLDELLASSDYISINTPLTDETRNMIDSTAIEKIKKGAVLINIARGAIVDSNALRNAVINGHIGGVANDVYEVEPCTDSVLKGLDKVVLTPHTAPYTQDTFIKMNNLTAQNVIDYVTNQVKDEYTV